jgi:capsular polysaccharide biosynthesis protein
LVLTEAFEVVEESAAGPEQAQQAMMAMLSRELFYGVLPLRGLLFGSWDTESPTPNSGPIAPLIPRYPDNYYHWMVETVPKIRYLRAFEAEQEPVTLLISADAPPFVDEALNLLGWPDSRIVRVNHESYHVSELLVPSFPDRRPADFKWLREEILESASDHIRESGKNIYVSRANGIERRVVNEDEVMDVLTEFDFERYLLEERSLAENARLFADADVIVGPHGAGLTDIVFAGDATLIELFGEKVKQPYKLLAEAVGVDYEAMHCTPESADIVVDIQELFERVSRACEE